jgi:endonuclease/exonuclease/phosphatase family metal-dependent hydrolase
VELTLASYNVHACVGRDRRFDPERTAAVIEELGPDLIGLQEVESRPFRGGDLLEYLGTRLQRTAVYGPTLLRADAPYGNALLVRGAVCWQRRHDLTVTPHEPRGALEVEVEVRGRLLRVIVTHFGLSRRERVRQAIRLVDRVRLSADPPTVLLGDFNEWLPWGRALRIIRPRFEAPAAPATYPAAVPLLALDRIWLHPADGACLRVRRHHSPLARRASDHLPVHAVLRL